jgi:vitamin B12 transporter
VLRGSYAYTRTEDRSTGEALLRRPRNGGSCSISFGRSSYDICVSGIFVGKRLDNDFYGPRGEYLNPSYSILDLAIAYRAGEGRELFCKFKNLTDERYDEVAGYPAPGMTVMAGTKIDF